MTFGTLFDNLNIAIYQTMKKYIGFIIFASLLLSMSSCKQHDKGHRKYYDAGQNVIKKKQDIHEIQIEDVEISNFGTPYILNDYLIISDYNSFDKLIHIFDKNTFRYITSVGQQGQGPSEIANMGKIISDNERNIFYVIDHGHQSLLSFPMDSVLSNEFYVPQKKAGIDQTEFPFMMQYESDTLSYALFMRVLNPGDYTPVVAKWNMQTGEREFMPYVGHREVEKKRVSFAASPKYNLYTEVYWYHDLITICTLDGELKYNLYGKNWDNRKSNKEAYFDQVAFCKDKIIASYWGDRRMYNRDGGQHVHYPDKLLIFDLEGNYISTLQIGYSILSFCYDDESDRLIFAFDDDIQFGYLDLDGII